MTTVRIVPLEVEQVIEIASNFERSGNPRLQEHARVMRGFWIPKMQKEADEQETQEWCAAIMHARPVDGRCPRCGAVA